MTVQATATLAGAPILAAITRAESLAREAKRQERAARDRALKCWRLVDDLKGFAASVGVDVHITTGAAREDQHDPATEHEEA